MAVLRHEDAEALRSLSRGSLMLQGGAVVSESHDPPDSVFVIEAGWAINSVVTRSGRRQIVDFLLPGDWAWPGIYCGQGASVIATLTPAEIRRVRVQDLAEHLRRNQRLQAAWCFGTILGHLLLVDRLVALGCRSGRERTLYLFWELIRRLDFVGLGEPRPTLPLSRAVIGDALGMTDRHVSRVVKWAEGEGLIRTRRQRIEVVDRARLHEAVGGDAFSVGLMEQIDGGGVAEATLLPVACGVCGLCGMSAAARA